MKYTIELTNKQKALLESLLEIVRKHIGFNPKLEPVKTTNVEDTNEYQIGYKTGYDLAVANAQETKLTWGKQEYNRGLEDAENAIDRLMDFTVADLEKEFGTEIVTDVWLENSIQDIIAITKAYEEKKRLRKNPSRLVMK